MTVASPESLPLREPGGGQDEAGEHGYEGRVACCRLAGNKWPARGLRQNLSPNERSDDEREWDLTSVHLAAPITRGLRPQLLGRPPLWRLERQVLIGASDSATVSPGAILAARRSFLASPNTYATSFSLLRTNARLASCRLVQAHEPGRQFRPDPIEHELFAHNTPAGYCTLSRASRLQARGNHCPGEVGGACPTTKSSHRRMPTPRPGCRR